MLLSLLLTSALGAAPAADSLTGTWRVTGDVAGNPVNELCTLAQAGATLTGTCKSTDAADAKLFAVTGAVKDGKATFSHGGDYQGQALTITYSGTLAPTKELRGSIDVQPFGVSGAFTASPVATPAPAPPPER